MRRLPILIVMGALALGGCNAPEAAPNDLPGIGANGRRDLMGAGVNVSGEKQGKSYALYDDFRDRNGTGLAFAGYGCESDCADVMKGYQRARREKISNPRSCSAPSWGEYEGCVAFSQGLPSELSSLPPLRETAGR